MFKIVNESEKEILLKNGNNINSFIESNVTLKKFTQKKEGKVG